MQKDAAGSGRRVSVSDPGNGSHAGSYPHACGLSAAVLYFRYDQELILRFFAIKNDLENYKYPVTEYLTRYLE